MDHVLPWDRCRASMVCLVSVHSRAPVSAVRVFTLHVLLLYVPYRYGLFYGGHAQLLLVNCIEVLVIIAWTVLMMGSFFFIVNKASTSSPVSLLPTRNAFCCHAASRALQIRTGLHWREAGST